MIRFVRYPSVSLSPTLSRNKKVEQHIRKKTHKLNPLRFWVEGGVIPLCGFGSVLILVRSSQFCLLGLPNKWYQSRWFAAWASTIWPYIKSHIGLDEYSLTLYRKSSWMKFRKNVSRLRWYKWGSFVVWKCFRSRGSMYQCGRDSVTT